MRLLISCSWEENLSPAPLSAACSRTLWHHFNYLIGDKLSSHLFLLFAIGNQVFDMGGALSIWVIFSLVEGRLVVLSVTDLEFIGSCATHFDFCHR